MGLFSLNKVRSLPQLRGLSQLHPMNHRYLDKLEGRQKAKSWFSSKVTNFQNPFCQTLEKFNKKYQKNWVACHDALKIYGAPKLYAVKLSNRWLGWELLIFIIPSSTSRSLWMNQWGALTIFLWSLDLRRMTTVLKKFSANQIDLDFSPFYIEVWWLSSNPPFIMNLGLD